MATIAIDVDLTTVDTGEAWLHWLLEKGDKECVIIPNDVIDYNLSVYFPEVEDPYDFWRTEDVYDRLSPLPNAEKVINSLCKRHDVVFVSAIKGNHHKSKYNFLKKHFPDMAGFIATKEKQFVRCDVMIDDRHTFLNKSTAKHNIMLETRYTQDEALNKVVSHCEDWEHIGKVLNWFGY